MRAQVYPSGRGTWRWRFQGRDYYFGTLDDPEGALLEWQRRGRRVMEGLGDDRAFVSSSPTVFEVCDEWMTHQRRRVATGELAMTTWQSYRHVVRALVAELGAGVQVAALGPSAFDRLHESLAGRSVSYRQHFVTITRMVFRWSAADLGTPEPSYGSAFTRPPAEVVRVHKHQARRHFYPATVIRELLGHAPPLTRACILLAINTGAEAEQVAHLTPADVRMRAWLEEGQQWGLIDTIRPKTAAIRRAPLWPETVCAIIEAHEDGHRSKEWLLSSNAGGPLWFIGEGHSTRTDLIGQRFKRLSKAAQRVRERVGESHGVEPIDPIPTSFVWLRKTFATVASEHGDNDAKSIIMGHTINRVDHVYVQHFSLERLKKTARYVRRWLYGSLEESDILTMGGQGFDYAR